MECSDGSAMIKKTSSIPILQRFVGKISKGRVSAVLIAMLAKL
jgi:hypothetical protein